MVTIQKIKSPFCYLYGLHTLPSHRSPFVVQMAICLPCCNTEHFLIMNWELLPVITSNFHLYFCISIFWSVHMKPDFPSLCKKITNQNEQKPNTTTTKKHLGIKFPKVWTPLVYWFARICTQIFPLWPLEDFIMMIGESLGINSIPVLAT